MSFIFLFTVCINFNRNNAPNVYNKLNYQINLTTLYKYQLISKFKYKRHMNVFEPLTNHQYRYLIIFHRFEYLGVENNHS